MSSESSSSSSSISAGTVAPLGKLKEPRDLYSTATLLHPIKWPVECQVIPEKIRHIDTPPQKLEPFYTPTGKEPQPQPVGVEMGTVVYDYQPKLSVDYFCRATVGGSQELQEFDPGVGGENTLRFESRFESGNLAKAIKVTNSYYELYLRPDLYTERHAQWFYFRIQNTKEGVQYRFSIVNFNKPDSLYRYGLKVLMYSEKEAKLNGVGWTRCGQNIAYFKNDISQDDNGPYYTLTFNLKFRHNNDTVYLAQCYPYTYSTLQHYLKSIEEDEFKSQLLTIRLLCRSLAGNNVHVLTITSPDNHQSQQQTNSSGSEREKEEGELMVGAAADDAEGNEDKPKNYTNKKPVIVISARVHPGESQSSFMMKGIIDFLTSDCTQAKELRDRFIFKLIPMLNPDGVIVGNSRCCLLGQDLNRQYRTVLREAFPQIYHAKVMLRRLQEENGIFLYCDLHGHSRRHNVFIYGCENRRVPEKHLVEQVFPLMMHKNAADKFSFQNCKFKIQKNKEGTGRIFVWTLGVVNSYTLEISLGGSTMPSRQYTHFNTGDYEACGRHFCETLLDYSDPSPGKELLRERILTKLIDEGSTADEPKNVVLSDYSSLSHSETEGDEDDNDSSAKEEDDDSAEPKGDSKTSQEKQSGQSSNVNNKTDTSKKELKRQVSVRKHNLPIHQHHHRGKSLAKSGRHNNQSHDLVSRARSPLPIYRATVDFTRIKQRRLEESAIVRFYQDPVTDPGRPNTPESPEEPEKESIMDFGDATRGNGESSKRREMSDAYRRLTKFRRKSRRNNTGSSGLFSSESIILPQHQLQVTAKCTRILFDDPFNPPGTSCNKQQQQYSRQQPSVIPIPMDTDLAWQSGTEDECDPYDDMTPRRNRPQAPDIKITDCDFGTQEDRINSITGDLSKLCVTPLTGSFHRSSSDTEVGPSTSSGALSPFTPNFPVGRAFLQQKFYPEKPSTPRSKGKLTSSLSDTTLAANNAQQGGKNVVVSSLHPTTTIGPKPGIITRRSSISYGTLSRTAAKLQATGSTLMPRSSDLPSPSSLNPRRRVSWTGTLTVSVPINVPHIPKSSSLGLDLGGNRKKSFRKSRSLNDKPSQETMGQSSSTNLLLSSGPAMMSRDGVNKGSGLNTRSIIPGTSSSSSGAAAATKKRRGKLKRSKHK